LRTLRCELWVGGHDPESRPAVARNSARSSPASVDTLIDGFVFSLDDLFDPDELAAIRAQIHDLIADDPYLRGVVGWRSYEE
jgi:hypothetical protein